jgi:hypothetical protein
MCSRSLREFPPVSASNTGAAARDRQEQFGKPFASNVAAQIEEMHVAFVGGYCRQFLAIAMRCESAHSARDL